MRILEVGSKRNIGKNKATRRVPGFQVNIEDTFPLHETLGGSLGLAAWLPPHKKRFISLIPL